MAASPAEIIRPLRGVEYDQLIRLGAFEDERIELLVGELVVNCGCMPAAVCRSTGS
jgi:hypothetical protein